MKLIIPIIITFYLLTGDVNAQHCPYDGSYIAGIRAISAIDTSIISNLKITKYDVNGDSLSFWPNGGLDRTDKLLPPGKRPLRFWFAKNNYVLVSGHFSEGGKIKIEDIDGDENGGHFETIIIDLDTKDIYPLCTNSPTWKGNFKPIIVNLVKKNK